MESGDNEIYVRPFPTGDDKCQISVDGGSEPRWRGDGKELFYLTPDGTMMSVAEKTDSGFNAAPPVTLFKTATRRFRLERGEAPVSMMSQKMVRNS